MYAVFKVRYQAYSLNLTAKSYKPMGLSGLEPPTSRLSGVRSNRLSYKPICPAFRFFPSKAVGGDKRIRTDDPLLAKQVLSQLSYTPIFPFRKPRAFKIKQRLLQVFRF